MENFGDEDLRPRAWFAVYQTLYFRAAIDVWNKMARMEDLQRISVDNYKFPPSIFMSPKAGRFTISERMLMIYSLVAINIGVFILIYDRLWGVGITTNEIVAIVIILLGLFALLLGSTGIKRWIPGMSDTPRLR